MNMPTDQVALSQTGIKQQGGATVTQAGLDLQAIIEDTLHLRALLERETLYLKEMKVEEVRALHEEKLRLIRRLELQKQLIAARPEVLRGHSEEIREELRLLQRDLLLSLQKNYEEVVKAREVNRMVVESVVKALGQQQSQEQYGAPESKATVEKTLPSLAFNKSV